MGQAWQQQDPSPPCPAPLQTSTSAHSCPLPAPTAASTCWAASAACVQPALCSSRGARRAAHWGASSGPRTSPLWVLGVSDYGPVVPGAPTTPGFPSGHVPELWAVGGEPAPLASSSKTESVQVRRSTIFLQGRKQPKLSGHVGAPTVLRDGSPLRETTVT